MCFLQSSCNKSVPKPRIRQVKQHKEDISLGGNPLDSDNPIRQKGVINSKPKVKRISRTKAMVFKAREEMQELKEAAKYISIKDNEVQVDKENLVGELWKPLCLLKANDVKKSLQNSQIQSEMKTEFDDEKEASQRTDYIEDEKLADDSSEEISEQNISNICTFPLKEVLEDSEIPPYKLLIHNNNFKRLVKFFSINIYNSLSIYMINTFEIFSRYCDNCITSELNEITEKLINQLVRYQYKKYQIDPVKAAAKKRYVLGLRQVKKYTKMNKTKLIIFVPNMEGIKKLFDCDFFFVL